jgi:hypothetical protein
MGMSFACPVGPEDCTGMPCYQNYFGDLSRRVIFL